MMHLLLTRLMHRRNIFLLLTLTLVVLSTSLLMTAQYYARAQKPHLAILGNEDHYLNQFFKQVENSVVQVTRIIPTANSQNPQGNASALGSGIVYDTNGHIITNNHYLISYTGYNSGRT